MQNKSHHTCCLRNQHGTPCRDSDLSLEITKLQTAELHIPVNEPCLQAALAFPAQAQPHQCSIFGMHRNGQLALGGSTHSEPRCPNASESSSPNSGGKESTTHVKSHPRYFPTGSRCSLHSLYLENSWFYYDLPSYFSGKYCGGWFFCFLLVLETEILLYPRWLLLSHL